ncbi:hypothetical protein Trydic_g20641 [Trypoxylus dichotomus]
MAKQTPGSKCDTGTKYELSVTAFVASFLSINENVQDYRIFSNFDEAQPFDDIVAEVQFKGLERRQIYAIQIKSGRDKLNVNKYCDGYKKIIGRGGLKFGENARNDSIHFWYFCSKSPTKDVFPMSNNGDTIDLKLRMRSRPYHIYETILNGTTSYELFSEDSRITDSQSFLNGFYLFLNQPGTQKVINIIKGMWNIDNPRLILLYLDNYFANTTKGLDKVTFEHELLKMRLSDYIVTPTKAIAFQHNAVDDWNRLTLKQDVTIVQNDINIEQYLFGCIVRSISDLINIDEWNCCVDNVGKLDRDVKERFKAKSFKPETLRDLTVQTFSHLRKSYIIIDSAIEKRYNEIKSYELSVFRHLGDVEGDKIMKAILVSLQGRKPVSLHEIIKSDGKLLEAVTCLDIISVMKPKQLYLKRECLDGNDYMLFVIETTNFQQRRHDDQQPNGTNIAIYCKPGESYEYYSKIRADPRFKSYKMFCLRLTDDNRLAPIRRIQNPDTTQSKEEYNGLECFFVDRNGENVYSTEDDDLIPIIGDVPIHVRWRYVPRFLREGIEKHRPKSAEKGDSNELITEFTGRLLTEGNFFNDSNGKITIVTGDAGMGKTTLLHSLFRFCESKYYLLFVDLVRYQVDLHGGKLKSFQDLLDMTRERCCSLPYNSLLNRLHDYPNRLVIILDSFDEIVTTCKQQILAFIKDLLKIDLQKVIIASRLTVINLLIDNFKAETFKIEGLNEQSDQHYLDQWNLNISNLHRIPLEFLSNPLYLNMLRAISESGMNLEVVDRWHLYEGVVKLKMEDYCRRTFLDETEKQYIMAKHGELPLKILFGPNKVMEKLERDVQLNYSNFMRLGFITRFDKETPVFIHHTFVEFFVVMWLIKNIGHEDAQYIYTLMLNEHKSDVIDIHSESFPLHKAVLDRSIKNTEQLCKENANCLLITDELGRSALHLAAINFVGQGLRILDLLIQEMRRRGYDIYVRDKIMKWTWIDYFEKFGFERCWTGWKVATKEAYLYYFTIHIEELKDCKFSISNHFEDCYDTAIYYSSINLIRVLLYLKYHKNKTFLEFREMCLQSPANPRKKPLNIYLPEEKLKGIHLACIYCSMEVVNMYIDSGANFDKTDGFHCTPLHYSIIAGQNNEIVRLLLENSTISNSYVGLHSYTTILHMSICASDVNLTKALLERISANLERRKWRASFAAMMNACVTKPDSTRLEIIKTLLERRDKQLYTLLELAIKYGNKDTVEMLLKYNADINFRGRLFRTPLCAAVSKQNREIIELLLQRGADPNYMKEQLNSPLMSAIERGDENVVQMLLDHDADANVEGAYNGPPLYRAITLSRVAITEKLLRHGADVNYNSRSGWTPLTYAICLNNSKDIVQVLLDYKADVDLKNKNGETPLSMAIKARNLKIIEILLQKGAHVDYATLSIWANRICADKTENESTVQTLLSTSINSKGKYGITPLSAAIKLEHADIVQILLNSQADVNCLDEYGLAPLTFAVETGNVRIAKLLLENKADVNFRNEFGIVALYVAAFRRNIAMVELLLEYGADMNTITFAEQILRNAKAIGKIEIIVRLLKNRTVSISNDYNKSNLATSIIESVTRNWAGVNLEEELRSAVKDGLVNLGTIVTLKQWGGDVDNEDEFWTAVFWLCEEMDDEMIDSVLLRDVNERKLECLVRNVCGAAGESRNSSIIRILSRCLVSCTLFLQIAVELGDKQLVQLALRNPAVVKLMRRYDARLCVAVRQENADIVRMLLEKNCAVNQANTCGYTPLAIAARIGNVAIAEILLAYGADVNSEGECCGARPLHIAALTENRCMVNTLLKYGAKENVTTFRLWVKKYARNMRRADPIDISTYNTSDAVEKAKRIIKEESKKIPKALGKRV